MITQKKIKEWIPGAVAAFRAVMPPIDKEYPAVYIASEATQYKVRDEPVRLTGSTSYETNTPYSAIMEYIHGNKGDAILIYQKHCPNDLKDFQPALSSVSGVYGDDLLDLMDMLYDQADKDNFWIIDEPTSELIGDALSRLSFSKSFRTNHEAFEIILKRLQ